MIWQMVGRGGEIKVRRDAQREGRETEIKQLRGGWRTWAQGRTCGLFFLVPLSRIPDGPLTTEPSRL